MWAGNGVARVWRLQVWVGRGVGLVVAVTSVGGERGGAGGGEGMVTLVVGGERGGEGVGLARAYC